MILLVATVAFVGCLTACSTFAQSLTVLRDLGRAGCPGGIVTLDDGTASQDSDAGTLTVDCGEPVSRSPKVPPHVLHRIMWREAPVAFTRLEELYFSDDDVTAGRLRAEFGPRPPGLGTGHRDALLFLGSGIAFLVMLVSSFRLAGRVRFGWPLPFLVLCGVPTVLAGYVAWFTGDGPRQLGLDLLSLHSWLVEAMVPDKVVFGAQFGLFLVVLFLACLPVRIAVIRQHQVARSVVGRPPGSYRPPPPGSYRPGPSGPHGPYPPSAGALEPPGGPDDTGDAGPARAAEGTRNPGGYGAGPYGTGPGPTLD